MNGLRRNEHDISGGTDVRTGLYADASGSLFYINDFKFFVPVKGIVVQKFRDFPCVDNIRKVQPSVDFSFVRTDAHFSSLKIQVAVQAEN